MKLLFRLVVLGLIAVAFSSCVTTPRGTKKFDPWGAVIRLDANIDDSIERAGYPPARSDYQYTSGVRVGDAR